ncbi:PIG-L family deacetylase [Streptomyces sp. NBC_00047]|uniref:PIG-L deacetylase family protein n=1 Tax=Streptomyces sp. NBC_00047 TaxID=2975627 RepID=UPI0022590490|nr:PIG-L family deacetylase [Streptomyces sp. NBC_00047]MCX5612966.1 PIG-L family deacetylase [Streptomyces sp. NBC_00047]
MTVPSLMGVFAHPDDESLAAGGVLSQHAAAGAHTAVVTATWSPASHRAGELAEALRILGAGEPRMLGYADHRIPSSAPGQPRLCDAPLDEAVERVVAHLRAFHPDIVLTHDAYGSSGHPDHIRTHQVVLLAVHAAGLEDLYPQAGPPWQPSALCLSAHPHSGARDLGDLVAGVGKRLRTVPDDMITATIDVRPWIAQKWAAIHAHQSEAARARSLPGLLSGLPARARERILATEWFIRHELTPTPGGPRELTA